MCSCRNIVSLPHSELILIKSTHFSFSALRGFCFAVSSAQNVLTGNSFSRSGLGRTSPRKLPLMAQLESPRAPSLHPNSPQPCFRHVQSHHPADFFPNTYQNVKSSCVYLLTACLHLLQPPLLECECWEWKACLSCLLRHPQFLPKCPAYCNHSMCMYWMNKINK